MMDALRCCLDQFLLKKYRPKLIKWIASTPFRDGLFYESDGGKMLLAIARVD